LNLQNPIYCQESEKGYYIIVLKSWARFEKDKIAFKYTPPRDEHKLFLASSQHFFSLIFQVGSRDTIHINHHVLSVGLHCNENPTYIFLFWEWLNLMVVVKTSCLQDVEKCFCFSHDGVHGIMAIENKVYPYCLINIVSELLQVLLKAVYF
jgi:hypothetical protein